MRKALTFFTLITVAALVSGCMKVVSTDPANGDTGVDRNAIIKVTFNMEANPATVNSGTFLVKDSLNNPVEGMVSYSKQVTTFTPKRDLALYRGFTVTIKANVRNRYGQPMGSDFSFNFTTRDGGWGIAGLIEDNPGDALHPQVAIDPNGNAIAVWRQWDGTRLSIWANRFTPESGWGTAGLIETDNAGDAVHPQVAIDPNGNAIVVWYQWDGTRDNIWSNRFTPASGWGTAELIETDNAGTAEYTQVAIDPDGNAIAAWRQWDGTRLSIWANRYTPASGWGTAGLIETDNNADAGDPQVAIDPNGNAIVVWFQPNEIGRYRIWANRYTPASGWGTAEPIEDNIGGAVYPQVAVDPDSNAIAVWRQGDGIQYNIWANRYTPASGWGTAGLIEDNPGDALYPEVAIDPNGNAIVVWCQWDGTRFNICANHFTPVSGWGTAGLIEDNHGDALHPQVAIDPNGNAIVIWWQSDGTRYNICANRFTPASGWGTAGLIETDNNADAGDPQVAIDPNGNAIAVWDQYDGTRWNIYANRFE